jgi:hypothetical protein
MPLPARRALVALLLLAAPAVAPAAAAEAAAWTPTASFAADPSAPEDLGEGAPRAGVAADGTSVVAFRRSTGTGRAVRRELRATVGDGRGRYGDPAVLTRAVVSSYSAAAQPGGDRLVAWASAAGLRAAVYRHGHWVRRTLTTGARSGIDDLQVAADPRGGWVVVATRFSQPRTHVEALSLAADGRRVSGPQALGAGDFGNEARPVFALAVDGRGIATFAYRDTGVRTQPPFAATLVRVRPHGGAWTDPVEVDGVVDARVTPHPDGGAVLAATRFGRRGDAANFGSPVSAVVAADGTTGPLQGPDLRYPGRAFTPSAVALGADRRLLVHALKARPAAFSTLAPVAAETLFGGVGSPDVRTLTAGQASEPIALPVAGRRALVLWAGARGWGDVLVGADGRRVPIAPPPGPPPTTAHFNATNRDARSAGRYVLLTWERAGRVRVSVRCVVE